MSEQIKTTTVDKLPEETNLAELWMFGYNPNRAIGQRSVRVPMAAFKGDKGDTPTIGANGNWFINGVDTGKPSKGANGEVTLAYLSAALGGYTENGGYEGTAQDLYEEKADKVDANGDQVVYAPDGKIPDASKGLEDLKEKLYGNETNKVFFPYTDDFTAGTIIKTGVPQNPPRRYTYANWSNILGKTIKKITVFCSNTNGGTFSMTFDETGSNPISYQLVYGKNEIEVNIPVPLNGLNVLWFNMDNIAYIDNPNGNKTGGKAYVYLYNKEKRIFNADINIGLEVAETVGNVGDIDQIRTDANIGKNKISIPVTSNPVGGG